MKVMLLNPPRYYWPFIQEGDNYLLPQSIPCLAAVLREHDIEVKVLDCLPLKIGWRSLRKILQREKPDVIGVTTSETMFAHEALRACKLAKKTDPAPVTVLGGHHFSATPKETLKNKNVDFIVIGEGEYTFLELVQELEKPRQNFKKVKGIAYRKNKKTVLTPPRPLIQDLDELPVPAYDLMPMDKYGKSPILWSPGGTTAYHSRGCPGNCDFCACWVHMADRKIKNKKVVCRPRWRTKSVERFVQEVELLRKKYNKKFLVFTDDTWNVDPKWSEDFADEMKERNLNVSWYAFMRADFLIRDEKRGILKKIVDSGLSHVCIGVERASNRDLKLLHKSYSTDTVKKAFHLLADKYPSVFRQGTFIVGFRNETKKSIQKMLDYARELKLDYPGFHPITPVPGTKTYEEAKTNGWLEIEDYSKYDWVTPIMSSERMSRKEIEDMINKIYWEYLTFGKILKGIFSSHSHRRNLYLWCILVSLKVSLHRALELLQSQKSENLTSMRKPKWYDN